MKNKFTTKPPATARIASSHDTTRAATLPAVNSTQAPFFGVCLWPSIVAEPPCPLGHWQGPPTHPHTLDQHEHAQANEKVAHGGAASQRDSSTQDWQHGSHYDCRKAQPGRKLTAGRLEHAATLKTRDPTLCGVCKSSRCKGTAKHPPSGPGACKCSIHSGIEGRRLKLVETPHFGSYVSSSNFS